MSACEEPYEIAEQVTAVGANRERVRAQAAKGIVQKTERLARPAPKQPAFDRPHEDFACKIESQQSTLTHKQGRHARL